MMSLKRYRSLFIIISLLLVMQTQSATALKVNGVKVVNPKKILFEVSYQGGFVPSYVNKSRLPILRLYTNGDLFVLDESKSPNKMFKSRLTRKQIDSVTRGFEDLTKIKEWGSPRVSDLPTTNFLYIDKYSRAQQVSIYALGITGMLKPSEVKNRAKLESFLNSIIKLKGKSYYKPKYYEAYSQTFLTDSVSGNNAMLANPAAVLCVSQGFTESTVETDAGTSTLCNTSDGAIDEWEYYHKIADKYGYLPNFTYSTLDCSAFRVEELKSAEGNFTSFLNNEGKLVNYSIKAVLPNEKPCIV